METKLTLKLNHLVIQKAKVYAKKKKTSLSKLIESYLGELTEKSDNKSVSPLVKSLTGVIHLKDNHNEKIAYGSYLKNKYGK